MRAQERTKIRRHQRRKPPPAPARLPGLNFDSFEDVPREPEGAYSTDRAPTYQARYAAEYPRRYVRKFLNWIWGRSGSGYKARGRSGAVRGKGKKLAGRRRAPQAARRRAHIH